MNAILILCYSVAGAVMAFSSGAFLLRYHLKSRGAWRHSLTGIALMTMGASTMLLATYVDAILWFGILGWPVPGRAWAGPTLFVLLAVATTLVWLAFERAQRQK